MKKMLAVIVTVVLAGCAGIKAPPGCTGTLQRINPPTVPAVSGLGVVSNVVATSSIMTCPVRVTG